MARESANTMRTLVCGPASRERDAICSLIEGSEYFSVIGIAETGAEAVTTCNRLQPDIMVIDDALPCANVEMLARRLAMQRPLPTLMLVTGEAPTSAAETDLMQRLRIYKLSKTALKGGENADLKVARTRLYMLRARANEPKRTLTRDRLAAIVEELKGEEAAEGASDTARRITDEPLELIVVAGGPGSAIALAELLVHVGELRVPVVAAFEEDPKAWQAIADDAQRLRIQLLEDSLEVRRSSGIFVALAGQRLTVQGEVVYVENGSGLDVERLFGSMAVLGPSGLSVLLAPSRGNAGSGLLAAARRGGHTARLDLPGGEDIHATRLSPRELAWALSHAMPKRV